jgi:hypothetical protein
MSRHRESLEVFYGADEFESREKFERILGRERSKDLAADYIEELAMSRGFDIEASKLARKQQEWQRTHEAGATMQGPGLTR